MQAYFLMLLHWNLLRLVVVRGKDDVELIVAWKIQNNLLKVCGNEVCVKPTTECLGLTKLITSFCSPLTSIVLEGRSKIIGFTSRDLPSSIELMQRFSFGSNTNIVLC